MLKRGAWPWFPEHCLILSLIQMALGVSWVSYQGRACSTPAGLLWRAQRVGAVSRRSGPILPQPSSPFCRCCCRHFACVAAGANLAAPTAAVQLNQPQCHHTAVPGVLLQRREQVRMGGWLGRDLSSSSSLELLQKPLVLHPQASSHHPPTAVTTFPKLPECTLKRREGHMDQLGFPGTQGHTGDGSDFLPGP